MKNVVKLEHYYSQRDLKRAIGRFAAHYNERRYHQLFGVKVYSCTNVPARAEALPHSGSPVLAALRRQQVGRDLPHPVVEPADQAVDRRDRAILHRAHLLDRPLERLDRAHHVEGHVGDRAMDVLHRRRYVVDGVVDRRCEVLRAVLMVLSSLCVRELRLLRDGPRRPATGEADRATRPR